MIKIENFFDILDLFYYRRRDASFSRLSRQNDVLLRAQRDRVLRLLSPLEADKKNGANFFGPYDASCYSGLRSWLTAYLFC